MWYNKRKSVYYTPPARNLSRVRIFLTLFGNAHAQLYQNPSDLWDNNLKRFWWAWKNIESSFGRHQAACLQCCFIFYYRKMRRWYHRHGVRLVSGQRWWQKVFHSAVPCLYRKWQQYFIKQAVPIPFKMIHFTKEPCSQQKTAICNINYSFNSNFAYHCIDW